MDNSLDIAAQVTDLAGRFAGDGPFSEQWVQAGLAAPLTDPDPSADLAEAMTRLGAQAGVSGASLDGVDAATAAALTPLVDAVRLAGAAIDTAFQGLTAEERALLTASLLDLDAPVDDGSLDGLLGLSSRVDMAPVHAAAAGLLQAVEAFMDSDIVPPAPAASASGPAGTPGAPAPGAPGAYCGVYGSSIVDPTGMVEVGLTANNGYNTERVLIVDLGGDDCYDNYAASAGPGSNLLIPVSVIVDVGGNDLYVTGDAHPGAPPGTTWSSGVGIAGIGLLVDRWGDDTYYADLYDEPSNCDSYNGDSWQRVFAQGVAILGVGGLLDLDGNDYYRVNNLNGINDASCSTGRVHTTAQAVGTRVGIGFLVDDKGNDRYGAYAQGQGKPINSVHVQAQAAAAARGVGLLVDKEGHDRYDASTYSRMGTGGVFQGAASASTFAQASLYGTNEPRFETPTVDCDFVPETVDLCGFDCTVIANCDPTARVDPCRLATLKPVGGVGVEVGAPCDAPAFALLVDLLGEDSYTARADAADNDLGCYYGVWSGVSAQGSAPIEGVAALVDSALDTMNWFDIRADSQGGACNGQGTRSAANGQGYGGSYAWDYWDRPPFDPLVATDLSIGLNLRTGACGIDDVRALPRLDSGDPCIADWADDVYSASATANNPSGGLAWAQTRVQGSGGGTLSIPGGPYDALGIGIHMDAAGDDAYSATAHTFGAGPLEPFVVAQAAAVGAVGVLVNVGDHDDYFAEAYSNGVPEPLVSPLVLAQADATADTVAFQVCVGPLCSTNTLDFAIVVFVDLFGQDGYSETCPQNGPLAVPYIWGNTLALPGCVYWYSGGLILGVDGAS